MTAQHWYWSAAGAALIVTIASGVADARRHRRAHLDRPGWVPWRGIQMAAIFAALLLVSAAIRS